ncbi:MAG: hypothetical protein ACLF0P_01825 [Thermoanaerobaculia bacterium]
MSSLRDRISPADPATSDLRVTLFTGLALLCKGAEVLSALPASEAALASGDPERFRLLSAGEAALGWLVGHGAGDSVDDLGRESALGEAAAALDWSEEELERHFAAALADWRREE